MDARDIQENPPVIEDGRYLEKIYELQQNLIDEYVKIEGNVAPPINVNTKKSQVLLKDFTGRVIEELAEGYESLMLIQELMERNQNFQGAEYSDQDLHQVFNHLQNAGEEMADAMHFFTELLIYINVMPEDILAYIDNHLTRELPEQLRENVIAKAMVIDGARIEREYALPDYTHCVNLFSMVPPDLELDSTRMSLWSCGHFYNVERYLAYKGILWDVAYHLNIARNFLKNKPWKQSQMVTDEEAYQEEVVKAFISMMGAFYTMGISDDDLYYLYFKKNRINCFRIRSKY